MRELNVELMMKYCTPVLNKSMCYINSSWHILNIRHCVYVSVKGSREYFFMSCFMYALKEIKKQEQQITSTISLIYNNEIEIGNSKSMG